jgi:hypothetical protein
MKIFMCGWFILVMSLYGDQVQKVHMLLCDNVIVNTSASLPGGYAAGGSASSISPGPTAVSQYYGSSGADLTPAFRALPFTMTSPGVVATATSAAYAETANGLNVGGTNYISSTAAAPVAGQVLAPVTTGFGPRLVAGYLPTDYYTSIQNIADDSTNTTDLLGANLYGLGAGLTIPDDLQLFETLIVEIKGANTSADQQAYALYQGYAPTVVMSPTATIAGDSIFTLTWEIGLTPEYNDIATVPKAYVLLVTMRSEVNTTTTVACTRYTYATGRPGTFTTNWGVTGDAIRLCRPTGTYPLRADACFLNMSYKRCRRVNDAFIYTDPSA